MPPIPASTSRMTIDVIFGNLGGCKPWSIGVEPWYVINRQLYLLATQIALSEITAVSVRIDIPKGIIIPGSAITKILWPLSRLGWNVVVAIAGVTDLTIKDLVFEQFESRYSFTAMAAWVEIKANAEDLVQRAQQAGIENTGVTFLPALLAGPFVGTNREQISFGEHPSSRAIADRVKTAMTIWQNPKWQLLSAQANKVLQSIAESTDE